MTDIRATWSGNIQVGTLVFPAKLYSGTKSVRPDFVQVHKTDLAPIQRVAVCSQDRKTLSSKEITRAIKHGDRYIEINENDVIKYNQASKDIVVRQFASRSAVSSLYYDKPYFITAGKDGELAYAVIRNALKEAEKIAIATYSLYGKQHIGCILPFEGILLLHQLRYSNEIVDTRDLFTPALPQPSPEQTALAVKVINKYSTDFHASDYRNEQQDILNEVVKRKVSGLKPKKSNSLPSNATRKNNILDELKNMTTQNNLTFTATATSKDKRTSE